MVDICYVISHGFAARMLIQTDLIKRLADEGKKIAIISPDENDSNFLSLSDHPNISLHNPEILLTIWDDDYGFKRMYYLEDMASNPLFMEKHFYSIWYSKSKHPWKRVRPVYYMLKRKLMKYFPSIKEKFVKNEGKYLESKKADQLIEELKPKIVVSTYPVNFLESKFLYAAKKAKIETVIHLLSWDNITSKGRFPVVPDRFIAWGDVMVEELKEYYKFPEDRIYKCGVPHFDQHIQIKENPDFKSLLSEMGLDPQKPYLFLAMSSPRFAPYEIDIVEWISKSIHENIFGSKMQFVVRPHPQNVQTKMADMSWIKRLKALNDDRIAVDFPQLNNSNVRWSMKKEDMNHLSNLLAGCSVCINSGSTVSIDALMMDKPVILTSFDADKSINYWRSARRLVHYPHQKKFIALGGAFPVHSYDALKEIILKYIDNPKFEIEKRAFALARECYKNDGKSTDRVIQAMNLILDKRAELHV